MDNSYQKRFELLNQKIKENNISNGILIQALGINRSALYYFMQHIKMGNLNKLVRLEKAVDKILKSDIYEEFVRGHVAQKIEKKISNTLELRDFLKKNNIKSRKAAFICGITNQYFNTLINTSKRYDLSTEKKDDIINTIKNYLKENDEISRKI